MSDRNAPPARIDPPVARVAVRGVAQRLARASATARQGARMIRRVPVIASMRRAVTSMGAATALVLAIVVAGIAVGILVLAVVQR